MVFSFRLFGALSNAANQSTPAGRLLWHQAALPSFDFMVDATNLNDSFYSRSSGLLIAMHNNDHDNPSIDDPHICPVRNGPKPGYNSFCTVVACNRGFERRSAMIVIRREETTHQLVLNYMSNK